MGCSGHGARRTRPSPVRKSRPVPFEENPRRSGGVSSLAEIKLQEGESIENALRRFKRKVQQEDIIKDIKKHSFYLKPGDRRRAKQALARKRSRKKPRGEGEEGPAVGRGSAVRDARVRPASYERFRGAM